MEEHLWISDTGRIVCERISCAGEELHGKLVLGRGLELTHTVGPDRYSRMSRAELAEFAPLISRDGANLACEGDHVRYDLRAQVLRAVGVSA